MIVWLASYPRSGNTFFRVLLNSIFCLKTYSIYDDKVDIGSDKKTSEIVGHEFLPKDFNIEKAREVNKLYIIKTHELFDERINENDKVIYLIRDGREATLSYLRFHNNYNDDKKSLIDVIYGNIMFGSWGEHLKSWMPDNRENCLLFHFEKLVESPEAQIESISKFLNIQHINETVPTFEELKSINPKFFRSGKIDSWKSIFSKEEHISFWLKNFSQMVQFGYLDDMPNALQNNENIELLLALSNDNAYLLNTILKHENKDRIINNVNQALKEKQQIINNVNQALKEKQQIINNVNQALKEKQQIINNVTRELKEKQQIIADLNKKTQENINTLVAKNQELKEKEIFISDLNKDIKEKEKVIDNINRELTGKTNLLKSKNQLLKEKEVLLNHSNNEIKRILSSKKYKLGNAIAYPYLKLLGKK